MSSEPLCFLETSSTLAGLEEAVASEWVAVLTSVGEKSGLRSVFSL